MSQLRSNFSNSNDEESLFDSTFRGGLHTLTESFYSQGSISDTFDKDYYTINLGVGNYTISMTSDASRYGYSTFNNSHSIQFDVTDLSGNVLFSSQQDLSKLSFFDDVLDFTSSSSGTFYVEVYDQSAFSGADYALELIFNGSSINSAPVADDDTAIARAGQTVSINIGANDSDADSDALTTRGLTNPTKGTVSYTDNFSSADTLSYTPFLTAIGTDSFTYQVSDGNGGTDNATVSVSIGGAIRGGSNILPPSGPSGSTYTAGSGSNNLTGSIFNDTFIFLNTSKGGTFNGGRGQDTANFSSPSTDYIVVGDLSNVIFSNASFSGSTEIFDFSSVENFVFSDDVTAQLTDLFPPTDIDRAVYRFFNSDTGTHFLSASAIERNSIINNLDMFNFEGPSFKAADPASAVAETVFRFFNTQTGTHFFTQSIVERDSILNNLPQFSFEGEAYKGYTEEVAGSTPLYRFFNTQTGTHFYTAAEAEKDSIIANLPTFNFEGIAYWVDPVMG